MTLGEILGQLEDESRISRLLPDLGDAQWRNRAVEIASAQGAALGEYASGAVERFASGAGDEDWISLMSALNSAVDPGVACLRRMIDWALQRDGGGTVQ